MESFKFKKNSNTKALQEKKDDTKKIGRPRGQEEKRTKHLGCYLTEQEYESLKAKLDGRPASTVVRELVLRYLIEKTRN